MFCKHCGHPVKPEDAVCHGCGQPVSAFTGTPEVPSGIGSDQVNRPEQGNQPDIPQASADFEQPLQNQAPYGNAPNAPQSNGYGPYGKTPQGGPQTGQQPTSPYSQMPQRPAYPGGQQSFEMKPKKRIPKWAFILIICAGFLIGIVSGIGVYTRQAAVNKAVTEMQTALMEAQALSEEVEALYNSDGGEFIKTDLTKAEIVSLQLKFRTVQKEPDETYAGEVEKKVNLSDYEYLITQIEERLDEAEEKRVARDEVNELFEVDAVNEEAYNSEINLPLALYTNAADIDELIDKYSMKDSNDRFWIQVSYVLSDAEIEILWIEDAKTAVEELEGMETISEADFNWAQDEIDYLFDGTVKDTYQARLDALTDRIQDGSNASADSVDDNQVEESVGDSIVEGEYETLEEFLAANPDLLISQSELEEMNEMAGGMVEISYFAEGNTLVLQYRYEQTFDSVLDLMGDQLGAQMEAVGSVMTELADELRNGAPDAAVRVDVCKSDGTVVWSKTY